MNNEASTAQEVHRVDTGKIYKDSEGNECSIVQMIKREPFWAANRIQEGEDALADNASLQRKVGDLQSVLYCLKRGTCFCEVSIGNPMYTDHSKACKAATKALSSNKEQQ